MAKRARKGEPPQAEHRIPDRRIKPQQTTIRKIEEIKQSKALNEGLDNFKKNTNVFIENSKNEIDKFVNSKEVKEGIDNAKKATVDVAEQARETLKAWLLPESEDK